MSFSGDLEHLPVVDIIQLLHSTRRSGSLNLTGPRGTSRLIFSDGYIVSANHRKESVRLGQVLVGMNALTQNDLDEALASQQSLSPTERAPLISILVESGKIDKPAAQKGLETLIVMTIIDVLTWSGGTFSLDVDSVVLSDEYRYFPEKLQQDFYVSTQNVLMDALRLYDEKRRDGEMPDAIFPSDLEEGDEGEPSPLSTVESTPGTDISEDLLGLDELDRLDKKIPDVFRGLRLEDPSEIHRKIVALWTRELPSPEQERLISALVQRSSSSSAGKSSAGGRTLILFSRDDLLKHAVATLCKGTGLFSFSTDDEASLDLTIEQSLGKGSDPLLLIDAPLPSGDFSEERLSDLTRRKIADYPDLTVFRLQIDSTPQTRLAAIRDGAAAILPKPNLQQPAEYVDRFIDLLDTLQILTHRVTGGRPAAILSTLAATGRDLSNLASPQDIALALAKFVATIYERSLTFVVADKELIAERSFGIRAPKSEGPSAPLKFRLPLPESPLLRQTVEAGENHLGSCHDPGIARLHAEIAAPRSNRILLLPLRLNDRTIAVIYGDFGSAPAGKGYLETLDSLSIQAGIVLENLLLKKNRSTPPQ